MFTMRATRKRSRFIHSNSTNVVTQHFIYHIKYKTILTFHFPMLKHRSDHTSRLLRSAVLIQQSIKGCCFVVYQSCSKYLDRFLSVVYHRKLVLGQ